MWSVSSITTPGPPLALRPQRFAIRPPQPQYEANPDEGSNWEEVEARILQDRKGQS